MSRLPYPPPFGTPRSGPVEYAGPADSSAALVRFFNSVYAWMATGLALTALVAVYVSRQPEWLGVIFRPGPLIGLIVVELALVWVISAAVNKLSPAAATVLFMVYAALNGLTLSAIFLVYTKSSIAGAFGVTAGTFAAMSIYGMVTKRDLSGWGSFLFMGLIGIVLASVVNIFWANSTLYWIITYAGVLVFVGLTAYDTQRLKEIAHATAGDARMASRLAISGALALYLDFINLFLMLLRIMGSRDE